MQPRDCYANYRIVHKVQLEEHDPTQEIMMNHVRVGKVKLPKLYLD